MHDGGAKWGVGGSRRVWVAPDACWWVETIKKKVEIYIKNSPKGPNDARCVIWALAGVPTRCQVSKFVAGVRGAWLGVRNTGWGFEIRGGSKRASEVVNTWMRGPGVRWGVENAVWGVGNGVGVWKGV
jgi:hypothetical protein